MKFKISAFLAVTLILLLSTIGCGGSPAAAGSQALASNSTGSSTTASGTTVNSTASDQTGSASAGGTATGASSTSSGTSSVVQVSPTTTLAAETGNNASTAASFAGTTNGNLAGNNVSKVNVHTLLYQGHTTKIFAHYMPWWGSNGHMNIGLNETDPAVVTKQVADAVSRGYDGFMIDWYGPGYPSLDTATKNVKAAAEATSNFQFAIVEDSGSLNTGDPTGKLLSDIQYMNDNYFSSPRYMRWNNRPVVAFFLNVSLGINWTTVRAQAAGNPIFIFRDQGGFTQTASDGSFDWIGITGDPTNMGVSYMDGFLQAGLNNPSKVAIASAYKGFDDSIASWGAKRKVNQQCGATWLQGFAEVNKYYSASNQLPFMQIPTWNDYEEGSEVETGIDNCVAVSAALGGSTLSWSIQGQESSIDHYVVYLSTDGTNLMNFQEVAAGTHTLNLAGFNFASGSYTLYVQAVGKPGLTNKMSAAVAMQR